MKANQQSTNCLNEQDQKLLHDRFSQQQQKMLKHHLDKTKLFIKTQKESGNKNIILLTSGGTSVPLEKNTVRMLQNFSTGTRGSLLAQQILNQNYPLIFFYRDTSFLPFLSGITTSALALSEDQNILQRLGDARKKLKNNQKNLLLLPFKRLFQLKQLLPQQSIILLCAAVSDFIPDSISQHKIHTQNSLQLKFRNSPKILGNLSDKRHLTVSFKLQTDKQKIDQRMNFAINKYNVDMVIGNMLNNKNWIKVAFNANLPNEKQPKVFEFSSQIQKNIIKTVFQCLKLKYPV